MGKTLTPFRNYNKDYEDLTSVPPLPTFTLVMGTQNADVAP